MAIEAKGPPVTRRKLLFGAAAAFIGMELSPGIALAPNERPPQSELSRPYFRVFIPGASGGGTSMTPIREALHGAFGDDIYVPASITTVPDAFTSPEKEALRNQMHAERIDQLSHGKNIAIKTHSFSRYEVIPILNALVERTGMKGRKIDLDLISAGGIEKGGLLNILNVPDFFTRGLELKKRLFEGLQHVACPLPDEYYAKLNATPIRTEGFTHIKIDTPADRERRRKLFIEEQLPKLGLPDAEVAQIRKRLAEIDAAIKAGVNAGTDEKGMENLMSERTELLKPHMHAIAQGALYPNEHEKWYQRYNEQEQLLKQAQVSEAVGLLHMIRIATPHVQRGLISELAEIIKKAQQNQVEVNFRITFVQHDPIQPVGDVKLIKDAVSAHELDDSLKALTYIEGFSHTGIPYMPEKLVEMFKELDAAA